MYPIRILGSLGLMGKKTNGTLTITMDQISAISEYPDKHFSFSPAELKSVYYSHFNGVWDLRVHGKKRAFFQVQENKDEVYALMHQVTAPHKTKFQSV